MSTLDRVLAVVAPHSCVGCARLGSVLCTECASMVQTVPGRCYICMKASSASRTCAGHHNNSVIKNVYVWGDYTDILKIVIHRLKYERAMQAAEDLIRGMPLPHFDVRNFTIIPVPTTSSRVRQRGYDQAALLANELARKLNLPTAQILRRSGTQHQVGANAKERRSHLRGAFTIVGVVPLNVILIDDVLTTGTTLEEAARILKMAGAKQIRALVIAQA